MHGIPALGDHLIRASEGLLEFLLWFSRRKQIIYYLESEHQPLKTLQQRVMQIAGEAGALGDTFLESQVKLPSHALHPQPEECHNGTDANN